MTRTCSLVTPAVLLSLIGLAACQEPGQRGPMERTGAYIDRQVTDAQRGMADFSQRAGRSVDQAGRSVGAGAQRVGTTLHDNLMPAGDAPPPPPPPYLGRQESYPPSVLPPPTPMNP